MLTIPVNSGQSKTQQKQPSTATKFSASGANRDPLQIDLFAQTRQSPPPIIRSQAGWICPECGGDSAKVLSGKGPHAGCLRCAGCDKFVMWLSKARLAALSNRRAA